MTINHIKYTIEISINSHSNPNKVPIKSQQINPIKLPSSFPQALRDEFASQQAAVAAASAASAAPAASAGAGDLVQCFMWDG